MAINTIVKGPQDSQFCAECLLGERKADVVVRLHDTRLMAIECKVSNSATNSVKRLNNDAAVKAGYWLASLVPRKLCQQPYWPVSSKSGIWNRRKRVGWRCIGHTNLTGLASLSKEPADLI